MHEPQWEKIVNGTKVRPNQLWRTIGGNLVLTVWNESTVFCCEKQWNSCGILWYDSVDKQWCHAEVKDQLAEYLSEIDPGNLLLVLEAWSKKCKTCGGPVDPSGQCLGRPMSSALIPKGIVYQFSLVGHGHPDENVKWVRAFNLEQLIKFIIKQGWKLDEYPFDLTKESQ